MGLEFVPLGFGERIEESGGPTADDGRSDIIQWIWIKIGCARLLIVDGAKAVWLAVLRTLAPCVEQRRRKDDRRKDSERFQGAPASIEGDGWIGHDCIDLPLPLARQI